MELCKCGFLYKHIDKRTVRIAQFTAANYKCIF